MNNTGFVLDESWHHSILHRWMLVAISYQYTLCITEGKWCQLLLDETMALLYSGACPLLRYTGRNFTPTLAVFRLVGSNFHSRYYVEMYSSSFRFVEYLKGLGIYLFWVGRVR